MRRYWFVLLYYTESDAMWMKRDLFTNCPGQEKCMYWKANLLGRKCILASMAALLILGVLISVKKDRVISLNNLPLVIFERPVIVGPVPSDFHSPWFCNVTCTVGEPCEYKDEVDFRIIVMTFVRAKSLVKCLTAISHLDTLGDKVSVEIWIDRSNNGTIDGETEKIAETFVKSWSENGRKGRACVHRQARNAFIGGQWIDTWRPKENTKELGLILEDDVSISPHAYR